MKAFIALPLLLLAGSPLKAATVEPSITYERGYPTNIRACGDANVRPFDSVCYNQTVRTEVGLAGVTVYEKDRNPAIRVRCRDRYLVDGVRAQVARDYCPAVEAGTLAPAPFLF